VLYNQYGISTLLEATWSLMDNSRKADMKEWRYCWNCGRYEDEHCWIRDNTVQELRCSNFYPWDVIKISEEEPI
jgi:hypothetical protein